jgi:hypothetical protein
MSRIFRNGNYVQNFGQSPALISQSGFPTNPVTGEIFFNQDDLQIYRYEGSWQTYGGGYSFTPPLIEVTGVGNFTNYGIRNYYTEGIGIFSASNDSIPYPSFPFAFAGNGYNQFVKENYTAFTDYNNVGTYLQSILTTDNDTEGSISTYLNTTYSQLLIKPKYDTGIASTTNLSSVFALNTINNTFVNSSSITVFQGSSINVVSPFISKTNIEGTQFSTIDYYAGAAIFGIEKFGTTSLSITNNYQLLINASTGFTNTATITNKWGVYQNGILDNNYLSAPLLIGTTIPTGRKLVVNGNIEIQTTAVGGAHTPSSLHLPIYVKNGSGTVQLYYLQLLN